MTDAELVEHLRELYHQLDEALAAYVTNPARARAAIRDAQEGIDEAVYHLVLRSVGEEVQH